MLITVALVVTAISIAAIAILPNPAYTALFAAAALASTLVHLLRGRRTHPSEDDLRTALELIAGQIIAAESEIERMQSLMRTRASVDGANAAASIAGSACGRSTEGAC